MADIGTDHGLLPAFLVATGHVPRAVGIDARSAPLRGAHALAARLGLGDRLALRLGEGCAPLAPGEVHTVTVAGMGGPLMVRILEGARGVERLVLQPNTGEETLRAGLGANGWVITTERVVEDRGRWFVVLAAERGVGAPLDDVDLAYGAATLHQDRVALLARLDGEARRVAALQATQTGARADAALSAQAARITEAVRRARAAPGG